MNTNQSGLIRSIWLTQRTGSVARRAALQFNDAEAQLAIAKQDLTIDELSILAANPLDYDCVTSLLDSVKITSTDDIKRLCAFDPTDRTLRRLLLANDETHTNTSIEEQHQLALDMDPGEGLDDLLIGFLPHWVEQRYDFAAETLLGKAGPVAAAHLLAATGPAQLTDEQVMHWICNPPARWEHPDPTRAWHQTRHVRNALVMTFTHRPGLARAAGADPDLARYAMDTPHWKADYAAQLPGVDIAGQKILDDTHNLPGTLLSLVWNPKTPATQARAILDLAEEAITTSVHSDDWKITASAAEQRLRVQAWHVDDFATVSDDQKLARMESRIKRAFTSWHKDQPQLLNGRCTGKILEWPKRFPEYVALLTNPDAVRKLRRSIHFDSQPLPEGTWTAEQFQKGSIHGPAKRSAPTRTTPTRASAPTPPSAYMRTVEKAATLFEDMPEADQEFAWTTLIDLVINEEDVPSIVVAETAYAVAA